MQLNRLKHTDSGLFFLLAGPCVIEGEEMALRIAERIVEITDRLQSHSQTMQTVAQSMRRRIFTRNPGSCFVSCDDGLWVKTCRDYQFECDRLE